MALTGPAPPRGSAAATANMRRRRTSSAGAGAGAGASGGAAGTMLQFYTDDAPGLKISPNVVLVMSIGFIAFVAVLHVMGKLYFGIQKQINPYDSVDPFSGGFSKRLIVDGFEFKYRNQFTPYVTILGLASF
ncbi:protein transport protein Sec61 subunit beta [Citrus sinensis]|nr:protein transport protein Sec61 subunit beta [Citrus sinensis]